MSNPSSNIGGVVVVVVVIKEVIGSIMVPDDK